jgi:hypothetical protein
MAGFEVKHIRGIPYYLHGTTIYTFELEAGKPSNRCTAIGTYDAAFDNIVYYPDWRERVQSNLISFRESLFSHLRSHAKPHEILEKLPIEPRILRVSKDDIDALVQVLTEFKEQFIGY